MSQNPYEQNREWNCPKCQTLNSGTSCQICGYVRPGREGRQPTIPCRSCGQQNRMQARYCIRCGKSLTGPQKKKKPHFLIAFSVIAVLLAAILIVILVLLGMQDGDHSSTDGPSTPVTDPPVPVTTAPPEETTAPPKKAIPETTAAPETTSPVTNTQPSARPIPRYARGDMMTLGTYNGQPVLWDVVDVRGNKVLLLTHYGLDCLPYNDRYTTITWAESSLRDWLNSTFLRNSFTPDERQSIVQTTVYNDISQGYGPWNLDGGPTTWDYIFLLSYAEAKTYFDITAPGTDGPVRARIEPTAFAVSRGAFVSDQFLTSDRQFATRWWLRSPGVNQFDAACVHSRGCLGEDHCSNDETCIRPAMWVDLEKLA